MAIMQRNVCLTKNSITGAILRVTKVFDGDEALAAAGLPERVADHDDPRSLRIPLARITSITTRQRLTLPHRG